MSDPVMQALLLGELDRHLPTLEREAASTEDRRRALHSLKGSFGVAGERELFGILSRLEARIANGETLAADDAASLLRRVRSALAAGEPVPVPRWPEPPLDLEAKPLTSLEGPDYRATMQRRLHRIDEALAATPGREAALTAYRELHAMKGAALAVGDEATSWFLHGLEGHLTGLRKPTSDAQAAELLERCARFRGVLGQLIVSPKDGLDALREASRPNTERPQLPSLPLPPRRPSQASESSAPIADDRLAVPIGLLDSVFERVRQVSQQRGVVVRGALSAYETSGELAALRDRLGEALRLIGPPRPWGAPSAAIRRVDETAARLNVLAQREGRRSAELRRAATRVRAEASAVQSELAEIRTTVTSDLFERVRSAVKAQAKRDGHEVRVQMQGGEVPIDRRLAEALFDPVLQLARNAVAHGIEPAADRISKGKPDVGTITLRARRRGGSLLVTVSDDGAGVDALDVRRRALATGTLSRDLAEEIDDDTLLGMLFVPGFTTRDHADLLAGRGVGLDLTLAAVRRLGGTISLASQPGRGLEATLRLPLEAGLVRVVWLNAERRWFAIPVQETGDVRWLGPGERAVPLQECLRLASEAAGAHDVVSQPPPTLTTAQMGPLGPLPRPPSMPGLATVSESGAPPAPPSSRRRGQIAYEASEGRYAIAVLLDGGEQSVEVGVHRVGIVEEVAVRPVSRLVSLAGPYSGAIVRGDDVRLCLDGDALAGIARELAG